MHLKTYAVTLMAAALLLAPAGVYAQGRHPRYLHARTDLPFVGPLLPDPWFSSTVTMAS